MAASVALIPLYIICDRRLSACRSFERVCGFDRVTAWYAAMPGGLQDMVIFGEEAGGDPRALSLIHATRVLIVMSVGTGDPDAGFWGNAVQPDRRTRPRTAAVTRWP